MATLDGGGRVAGRAGAAGLVDHAPYGIPIDTARCEGNDHVIQSSHESPFVPRRRRRAGGHPGGRLPAREGRTMTAQAGGLPGEDTDILALARNGVLAGQWSLVPGEASAEVAHRHLWNTITLRGHFRQISGAGTLAARRAV